MPSNPMARFEIFIGIWNTTGEVRGTASSPAGVLQATDTYWWLPGKRFIVHDVDARFDGRPTRSMEVIGCDARKRHFFANSYDDTGVATSFILSLDRRRLRIRGESVRFEGGFDKRGNRLSGLWKQKVRNGRWQPWIDLELVRA